MCFEDLTKLYVTIHIFSDLYNMDINDWNIKRLIPSKFERFADNTASYSGRPKFISWSGDRLISFHLLAAFAKFRKKRILASTYLSVCPSAHPSVCLCVCPSVRNNSAPTWQIFMKFDIGEFFENLSRRFEFNSNLTRITGNSDD
jgi:hypothetical protein